MIETNRLKIIKTSIDDVDLLLKMDKQEDTQMFLGGIKNKTREERIEFLKKKKTSLTVVLKDNTRIGFAGISKEGLLGYIFDYDYTGHGYCHEACKAIIDNYFINHDVVYAEVNKNNVKSINVLKRLNFKFDSRNEEFDIYKLSKK